MLKRSRWGLAAVFCGLLTVCRVPRSQDGPEVIVDRHLDAYNRHDLDGLLSTYDDSCAMYLLGAPRVLHTRAEMRSAIVPLFDRNPNVHSETMQRFVLGHFVVDRDRVTGVGDFGPVTMLAIYEIRRGRLVNYWQSPVHPRAMGSPPTADSEPDVAAITDRSIDALNRRDLVGAAAAYGDTVLERTLTADTAANVVSHARMVGRLEQMMRSGAGVHVSVRDQVLVGPYVATEEHISGLAGGKSLDRLVVSEVKGNHIVADWDGMLADLSDEPDGAPADAPIAPDARGSHEILHAEPL